MRLSREGQYLQNQIAAIMRSLDNWLNSANNRFREFNGKLDAANERIRQYEERERVTDSVYRFHVYINDKRYSFSHHRDAYMAAIQYGGEVQYFSKTFQIHIRRHVKQDMRDDGLWTGEDVIPEELK